MYRLRLASRFAAALLLVAALPSAAQVANVEELTYPPLPSFDPPQPTRVVLDNGLVVMLLEDHELPLIDVFARIRTGSRHEPAGKVGLASLTGTVLRTGGTELRSGDEIDDYLESRAASIETGIDTVSGSASMSCLKEDFVDVLGLFAEILRRPVFAQDKLDVAKNQLNAGIARQNDSPQQVLFREFAEIVYGADSPYARNPTYTSVAAVGRPDLIAWHQRYFHPNNVILGVVGDFDSEQVLAEIRAAFGDWPAGPAAPPPPQGDWGEQFAPGVYYARKDDMTQSNIMMGHLGIRRDNPDYLAVELVNEIFSGGFASRLFSNVRTKKGLAYAVSGGIGAEWDYPGDTGIFMTTKTESTGAGIEALLEEARGLSSRPPTQEELDRALAGILNSFVFNSDSRREILSQQLTYEYFGYPLDWLSRYYRGIQQVGLEQVRAAARDYLEPDRFAILVVGPEAGRDRALDEFGTVRAVDISIPELEVEAAAATPEATERGRELVARVVAAHGGGEALDALVALRQSGQAVAHTPQGAMQIKVRELVVFPDRYRQEVTLPFGTMTTVVTPDGGFVDTPQGARDLPESQLADTRKSIRRDLVALLRLRDQPGFEAVATGAGEIDGRAVERLQIKLADDLIGLAVDAATGEVVEMSFRGSGFGGGPGEVVQTFSDVRAVGGLRLPHRTVSTFEGEPYIELTTDAIELDPQVGEEQFDRPVEEAAASGG